MRPRKLITRLGVALAGLLTAAALVAPPAFADTYWGDAESTFSCWQAPSGNNYCATIHSTIAQDVGGINAQVAYRVHIWCTVNGNPSNCEITWVGGLKRYRSDLGREFATYPWGTATQQTGGGSDEVIWQGGWHTAIDSYHYVYQTVGSVNVHWVAPNHDSSTKTRCSDAMLFQGGNQPSFVFSGPLDCM